MSLNFVKCFTNVDPEASDNEAMMRVQIQSRPSTAKLIVMLSESEQSLVVKQAGPVFQI